MKSIVSVVTLVLLLAAVGCAGRAGDDPSGSGSTAPAASTAAHDAECGDAGAPPTYAKSNAASYTGASGTLSIACNGSDVIQSGDCVANDGRVRTSMLFGANGWTCTAAPDLPEKGELLIVWIECRSR